MAIEKVNIERFLELSGGHTILDVRSPAEFKHAHIPGAINLPLFTDEERKIVGTSYKQDSREAAIKLGLDFFGPKMRTMVEAVERITGQKEQVSSNEKMAGMHGGHGHPGHSLFIYCWRGGMRSAGVSWLMDLYGFKIYTLAGGYKKFREYVLKEFKQPFSFNLLGGYTGSGKTVLLKELKQHGETVIDLEDIARHKGSAFGNMDLAKQPSQEMFENLLALQLKKVQQTSDQLSPTIWLEDESQRIGDLNIPHELWKTMRQSLVYFIDIPFEHRLNYIVEEYGGTAHEKLEHSITRIEKRLGGLETKNAINFLREENTKECFRILLKYYDKWYLKSLHNRENANSLLINVPCEQVGPQNIRALLKQAILS